MISKIIDANNASQLKDYISQYEKVVITTHVSPDGDAIGSSLGLYHYLKVKNIEATIIVPNAYPSFFNWMAGSEDIIVFEKNPSLAEKKIADAELLFCLDFNTPSRTRFLEQQIIDATAKKVMIDHHPEPDDFCDLTFSYPEMSSTCELLFRVICKMEDYGSITKQCAEAIYTGMMTDTGGFIFNSNKSDIYLIISQLISIGIDKDQIYRNVYNNYSVDRYRMMGYALSEKMRIYPEHKAALISLTNEEQVKYNAKKGDTEGFANLPLNIKDILFAVFIREDHDQVKISLRSQGNFPTNRFAAQYYNGGGHLNASGGEFKGSLLEAIEVFEKALPEYVKQLNQ